MYTRVTQPTMTGKISEEKPSDKIKAKMVKLESIMKNNDEIEATIVKNEVELSKLKAAADEMYIQNAENIRKITEDIKRSEESRRTAEKEMERQRKIVEKCDENIAERKKQKKTSEDAIDVKMLPIKEQSNILIGRIRNLKKSVEDNLRSAESVMRGEERGEARRLVTHLARSLQEKEECLTCPVCLEVASPPIFSCRDQHLVCSACRPKVDKCPECRERYSGPPLRHRFAEVMARDMAALREELARESNTNTRN